MTETDGFGDFWFKDLEEGTFSLTIEAEGFAPVGHTHRWTPATTSTWARSHWQSKGPYPLPVFADPGGKHRQTACLRAKQAPGDGCACLSGLTSPKCFQE